METPDLLGLGLVGWRGLGIFWGCVLAIAAVIAAVYVLVRNGRLAFTHRFLSRLPVVGRAFRGFDEATFIQTLGMAIESGINASDAIDLAFKTCRSDAFRSRAQQARDAIRRGREMHLVLHDSGLFSAGSGKSTTLYACLRHLVTTNGNARSIVAIEDPIEVPVDGVTQSRVNLQAGFDLKTGLRSLMRQDPEVIVVGEIRDRDTAEFAIQASLTGQLLLAGRAGRRHVDALVPGHGARPRGSNQSRRGVAGSRLRDPDADRSVAP